ncbi:NAD(P)/FAD-dependent oxidoreductase [Merismopedia glauca]|uniref:Flavin-dependent dehydrogenase n=1 Tax=Merismopedia glauca CCAP 1448/3 TaxID=1296344 RepID=A0A2T1C167_9CYAN|nr:flavin-dependent dehydrogenase [Merismopedia glauca]PSB02009.1 flavin-dependent dehydrogenase [Merismopedia glauca CCAP 1448/3]
MQEILYLEVPTPDTDTVRTWLQQEWSSPVGVKIAAAEGIIIGFKNGSNTNTAELKTIPQISVFVWSLQRTTYLKAFRWTDSYISGEKQLIECLQKDIFNRFPNRYPEPPEIDLSSQSIFAALEQNYPLTVKYFQKMPNGEYDLNRVYWWEKRWRESVRNPQDPKQVIWKSDSECAEIPYDLIYVGGALGVIHAAVMAQLGYKVLLVERLPFGRMNREWNISRDEFQSLIDLGLFTPSEFESVIAREYVDGFNKFFDSNNPPHLKAPVLHTPKVLNIGIDAEKLLRVCGEKLKAAGGQILDETEFTRVDVTPNGVRLKLINLVNHTATEVQGRLLVDAMGTASPIAWQLNGIRAFDSVCPTVGAAISSGFDEGVWDSQYGDVLYSHGDISRGRQLIWELFPAEGEELTIYLFHYHQVHPDNPGSLLEMYEDFFTILPEYRRCDVDKLVWRKPTFGYIPGHFSVKSGDRAVSFDRIITIGDAASLQSPLIFTGFGSLVRNLPRLTTLLDTALKHDLLDADSLGLVRAFQSNISVTWLFSKGMMVPTHRHIPPARINSMLNTFFGLLADSPPEVADTFIKDKIDWLTFNKLALKAANKNPALLLWIWDLAGAKDLIRWLGSYLNFTWFALLSWLFAGWLPKFVQSNQSWLEKMSPRLWLWLLAQSYALTAGMGQMKQQPTSRAINKSAIQKTVTSRV